VVALGAVLAPNPATVLPVIPDSPGLAGAALAARAERAKDSGGLRARGAVAVADKGGGL
jgi:hypothetical protein